MNTKDLIELDLDRLRRLDQGKVDIEKQTDVQITYRIVLKDSHDPAAVIKTTGQVQNLFGPRLLSSSSYINENLGPCVTARVCLQSSKLIHNQPALASFLARASWFDSLTLAQQGYLKEYPSGKYTKSSTQVARKVKK